MTLKTLVNYLKFSGVWVSFALNPYHWRISFGLKKPDDLDPAMHVLHSSIGPISIRIVVDDGSW
jgi:hypothetical protein